MNHVKLNAVWEMIKSYCNNFQNQKPLIFWFNSNSDLDSIKSSINNNAIFATMQGHPFKQGNEYMILNGKQVRIIDHPEVFENFVMPSTYMEGKTKLFVYHRYMQQLDMEQLQYCLDVVNIGNFPVICLMNDYSKVIDKPSEALMSFISNNFDQYSVSQ